MTVAEKRLKCYSPVKWFRSPCQPVFFTAIDMAQSANANHGLVW
jgi:hypothetical protein